MWLWECARASSRAHLIDERMLTAVAGSGIATRLSSGDAPAANACSIASSGLAPMPALRKTMGVGRHGQREASPRCAHVHRVAGLEACRRCRRRQATRARASHSRDSARCSARRIANSFASARGHRVWALCAARRTVLRQGCSRGRPSKASSTSETTLVLSWVLLDIRNGRKSRPRRGVPVVAR